ncbi:hypothetical protein AGRA3207_002879 [Actinomadura graeca]|uniref:XRE family transcriptional regulator n=1 Tax=Actinomadura graeca TaxID=2750812 RepID=A0ABX8QTA8_9ACTN|nr:hypothetical protein [Actinomadura graeca]QXJ21961.1 hypothetical protein AGRA3207_002879 [Actinomadura graeca]
MTEEELFPEPPLSKGQGISSGEVDASVIPDVNVDIQAPPLPWEDDMERRVLLQLATLGISVGTLGSTGEPVRQLLALALNSEPRDLDDWHLTVSDHLHAVRTRPPAKVRDGLVVNLIAVQRQLQDTESRELGVLIELRRVVAALTVLYANTLTRLGDDDAAIHWWRTAKTAADATGDLDLRLGVRATEAGHGLYGQRDPATVLNLIDQAQRITGHSPRRALIARAQALAFTSLGRHVDARRALRTHLRLAETASEAQGIMADYWDNCQSDWAELQIYAAIGDEPKADRAAEHNLARISDHQYVPMIHLQRALCTMIKGGTDHGVKRATEIFAALPPAELSHMITETGKRVLRAVPVEQRDRPTVRELHALISA